MILLSIRNMVRFEKLTVKMLSLFLLGVQRKKNHFFFCSCSNSSILFVSLLKSYLYLKRRSNLKENLFSCLIVLRILVKIDLVSLKKSV